MVATIYIFSSFGFCKHFYFFIFKFNYNYYLTCVNNKVVFYKHRLVHEARTHTNTYNTYQSLLSLPINFLVSSSSIIVGGASDDGPYCADAIRRSVEGFSVRT